MGVDGIGRWPIPNPDGLLSLFRVYRHWRAEFEPGTVPTWNFYICVG
jgi:hypothetical protein